MGIAGQYTTKFGQTPAKAAPSLLTFVLYDVDPTNDHSERAVRFVMGVCNVRVQMCDLRGMWWRNILWTCIRTWRLRRTPICRELWQLIAEGTFYKSRLLNIRY